MKRIFTLTSLFLIFSLAGLAQPTNIVITPLTPTSLRFDWTASGTGNNVLVVIRNSTSNYAPANGSLPATNLAFPTDGAGTDLDAAAGNIAGAIYSGAATTVNVTGLAANTAYFIRIYEYTAGPVFIGNNVAGNPLSFNYFTSNGTWTAPFQVANATVQAWGGGGGSAEVSGANRSCNGGGGGAYAQSSVVVTPLTGYSITVGGSGAGSITTSAGGNGGNSIFGTNVVVAAGGSGSSVTGVGGAGGTTAASTGTIKHAGGAGGARVSGGSGGGGGGGGSAGSGSDGVVGGDASAGTGGTAGAAGTGGGAAGGAGGNNSAAGNPGGFPGGGGGGQGNGASSTGSGNSGLIIVSYVDATAPTLTMTLPAASGYSNGKVTYTINESLGSGTVTWLGTAGADAGNTHTQALTGTELAANQTNHTLTNAPAVALVSGSTYTVTFSGNDLAGNAATSVVITGVIFDNTPPTVATAVASPSTGSRKIGDQVTISLTAGSGETGLTAGAGSTINGQPATFTESPAGTYNFVYTLAPGNTNWAAGALPFNLILQDAAGNVSTAQTAFTTANTLSGDANAPTNQNTILPSSVAALGGSAVTIVAGTATDFNWLAPVGTTNFVANGTTITTAAGNATSITAPSADGNYQLFVLDAAGNYSAASTATVSVFTQASNIVFTTPTGGTQLTINWTNGTGGNRLVILKTAGATGYTITNGTTYAANLAFGSGADLNGATAGTVKSVYDGTGSGPITVTGLTAATAYTVEVYEYATGHIYLSNPATANRTTVFGTQPAAITTTASFSAITGTSMTLTLATPGPGTSRILVANAGSAVTFVPTDGITYPADPDYSTSTDLGSGNKVVGVGAGPFNVSGLTADTKYFFTIYEFNGAVATGAENYNPTGYSNSRNTTPTTATSGFSYTGVTETGMTLNWTTLGDGDRRMIIMRQGALVATDPTNQTAYTANGNFNFGVAPIPGSAIGAGIVVYDGTGASVALTNLLPNTTYYFSVYDYNSFEGGSVQTTTSKAAFLTPAATTSNTTLVDATPPSAALTVGALTPVGGRVVKNGTVATYWNSTNTQLQVVVPLTTTDGTLDGGSVQVKLKMTGGAFAPIAGTGVSTITSAERVAGTKTITIQDTDLEGTAGFSEGNVSGLFANETKYLLITAETSDLAGNPSGNYTTSTTSIDVDQTVPTVTSTFKVAPGAGTGGRDAIEFLASEPLCDFAATPAELANNYAFVNSTQITYGASGLSVGAGTTVGKLNNAKYIYQGASNTVESTFINVHLVYLESNANSDTWDVTSGTKVEYVPYGAASSNGGMMKDAAGNEVAAFNTAVSAGSSTTLGLASNGVAVGPNINNGSTNQVVFAFSLNASSTVTLSALSIIASADPTNLLSNFRLYSNSSDNFGTATNLSLTPTIVTVAPYAVNFNSISTVTLTGGTTTYFYLVANVPNYFYSLNPTINFSMAASGLPNAAGGFTTSAGGYIGATQTGATYTLKDLTAPSIISITNSVNPIYLGGLTQTVAIKFSEPMNNTTAPSAGMITISGPANWGAFSGGVWSTGTLTNDTYTVTIAQNGTSQSTTENSTITATSGITDWGGNANPGGTSASSFTVDTQRPTVTTVSATTTATPTSLVNISSPALTIQTTFSEPMNTGVAPTIVFSPVNANFTPGAGAWTVGNTVYTITYTHNATAEEIPSSTVTVNLAKDANGNVQNVGGASGAIAIDTKRPTVVSINRAAGQYTNGPTVSYVVTFSEYVNNVDEADFTPFKINGTVSVGNVLLGSVTTTDNVTWNVSVTNLTGDGDTRLDLAASPTINDSNNNALTAPHTGDQFYSIDNTPPTVTSIVVDNALLNAWSPAPVNGTTPSLHGNAVDYIVTFSEPVSGLDLSFKDFNGIAVPKSNSSVAPFSYTGIYAAYAPFTTFGPVNLAGGSIVPTGGAPATQWVITANYAGGTGTFEVDFDPSSNQANKTGTISSSILSTTITGSGTLFTIEVAPGASIQDSNHNYIGTVLSITNDTQLILTSLASATVTNSSYISTLPNTPYVSQIKDRAGNLVSTPSLTGPIYTFALPEPTNPVSIFTAPSLQNTSIKVQWTNPGGAQDATGYLVMAKPTVGGAYPGVADGTYVLNNATATYASLNVPKTAAATQSVTFNSLNSGVSYDFIIYPYTFSPLDSIANGVNKTIDFNTATPATVTAVTTTSTASTITLNVGGATILSTVTASPGQDAMKFTIQDDGATPAVDNAPFKFSSIKFTSSGTNNITKWTEAIGGALLYVGAVPALVPATVNITDTDITFSSIASTLPADPGFISDNGSKQYTLKIWLKSNLSGTQNYPSTIDGLRFDFKVDGTALTYDNLSSNQKSSQSVISINSGANTVDVQATALAFTTQPSPTSQLVLTDFSTLPVVKAVDVNGNTDLGFTGAANNVTITNTSSVRMNPGNTATVVLTPVAGIITFPTHFQYTDQHAGGFVGTLTATGGGLNSNSGAGFVACSTINVSFSTSTTITAGTGTPNISSIAAAAVNVFTFSITDDGGAGGDGADTKISSLKLVPKAGNQFGNFQDLMASATLTDNNLPVANSMTITPGAGLNTADLTFSGLSFATGSLGNVPDSQAKIYTLTITLKTPLLGGTLPSTADGLKLVLDMQQGNITTDATGSNIIGGQNQNSGTTNGVFQVFATKLAFTTDVAAGYLVNVNLSAQAVQPVVEALDTRGNRDLDYSAAITTTTTVVTQSGQPTTFLAAPNGGLISAATFGGMKFTTIGTNAKITVHSTVQNADPVTPVIPSDAVSSLFAVQVGSATTVTNATVLNNIPSTTNASPGVDVFSFKINEDAANPPDDGNPTLVSQITVSQSNNLTNNTNSFSPAGGLGDWTQAIAGAQLRDNLGHTMVGVVNATSIVFSSMITTPVPLATDIGYIPDGGPNGTVGSAKTYTLSIWLKTSLGGVLPIIIDNLKFGFDVTTSGIVTNGNGTNLTGGQQALSVTGNTVNVVASKINYLTTAPIGTPAVGLNTSAFSAVPSAAFPSSAAIYTPFDGTTLPVIGAETVDANGNRDLDYTGTIQTFSLANSLTDVHDPLDPTNAPVNKVFSGGTFTFDPNFQYTTGLNQDGSITMSSSGGANPTLNTPALTTSTPINIFSATDSYIYFDPSFAAQTFGNFVSQQAPSGSLPNVANATVATMAQMILSDGGAANFASTGNHNPVSDNDRAFTRISSLKLNATGAGAGALRALALYDNAGNKISSDMPAVFPVTFNGLNIQAADNSTVTFTVRGTFKGDATAPHPVNDHDQVQFQIAGATWSAGSQLYNYNGGSGPYFGGVNGGALSLTNDLNVVASSLDFVTQPYPYAGINQPIDATTCTGPGPYTGIVNARDKFANLDTDFSYGYVLSANATPSLATPTFTSGVLNLAGMKYTSVGTGVHPNGTLTVTSNGLNSNTVSSANSIPCSRVDVIDVGAMYNLSGAVTTSANLKGGQSPTIFAVDIAPAYMVSTYNGDPANEPSIKSLTFSFDVPYQTSGPTAFAPLAYTSFTGFTIFESTNGVITGSSDVTIKYPGASLTLGKSVPASTNYDLVKVTFASGHRPSLYTSSGVGSTLTYFLQANVSITANTTNPKITPRLIDNGYNDSTISITQGSSLANVVGPKPFGFASTKPPSLVGANCVPYVGQPNVDPVNTHYIDLAFDVSVFSFDGTAILWDKTAGTQAAVLTAANGYAAPATNPNWNNPAFRTSLTVNPLRFNIPNGTVLIPDHVYYVTVAQGKNDPTGNGGLGTGAGISDDQLNLFGGISYNGTMYFKISSVTPPVMTATTSSSYVISPTVASFNATFNVKGKAYYLILDHALYNTVADKPTTAQIKNPATYGKPAAVITFGSDSIKVVDPNPQFFNVPGNWSSSITYDVWIYAENDGLLIPTPTAQPYGFVAGTPPTYPVGAPGPTFSFSQPTNFGGATPYTPIYQICPNSYSILSQPIIITETAAGAWNAGSSRDFNVTLPSGFDFDIKYKPIITLVGGDFHGIQAVTTFINSTLLNVSYTNSGTSSIDQIVISNMRVIANSASASGNIKRFSGSGIPDIVATPANPNLDVLAKISANTLPDQAFTNSYTTYNNFNLSINLPNVVTSIPDNFIDLNLPASNNNAIRLVPTIIPSTDFNASFFSGSGVSNDVLSLSTVSKNTAFDITMTHTDLNGCFLSQSAQYIVYDHTNIIPKLTDNSGVLPNYGANICLTNPQFTKPKDVASGALSPSQLSTTVLNFNDISGYQLDSMVVNVPVEVTGFSKLPTASTQIIYNDAGGFWQNQLNQVLKRVASSKYTSSGPALYHRSYKWDYAPLLNINSASASGGAIPNPYDNFKQRTPVNGNNYTGGKQLYYTGGSLGYVDFIGKFQSTADPTLYQPLVQRIQLYVPALPLIEVTGQSSMIPSVPYDSTNTVNRTYVFCEQGNDIVFNGYPAASPGKSKAYYSLYDSATYGTPAQVVLYNGVNGLPSSAGFTDNANSNGTATLKPNSLVNNNKTIRVEYTYQDNNSPCAGTGVLYIKIAPNPIANFTFTSVVFGANTPNASNALAYCEKNQIDFQANVSNPKYTYTWNFNDPNSSSPSPALGSLGGDKPSHTFSVATSYNVDLTMVSDFGCASIPAAVPPAVQGTTVGKKTITVKVGEIPIVDFSFLGNCVKDNITFTDNSTTATSANPASAPVAKFDWDFGDGSPVFTGYNLTPAASAFTLPLPAPFTYPGGALDGRNLPPNVANVAHQYQTPGRKTVKLTVTTNLGCTNNSSHDISQLPIAKYQASAYGEDFNTSDGGWIAVNLNGPIPDATAGSTSWVYDNTKWTLPNTYAFNEKSALYTACLDLSAIARPAIQFDGYFGLRDGDGIVLQYSTDTKNIQDPTKTWDVVGTTTDGLDWYSNIGVPSNPGTGYTNSHNQTGYGWEANLGQKYPKHALDNGNTPPFPNNQRVILRFAFNSGTSATSTTGAWIDNVRVGSRTRTVLFEKFTTTDAGNAAQNATLYLDDSVSYSFVKANLSSTQLININYHLGLLGQDPFNMDYSADASARALYYNIKKIPYAFIDAQHSQKAGYLPLSTEPDSSLFRSWGPSFYSLQSLKLAKADFRDPNHISTKVTNSGGNIKVNVSFTPAFDLPVGQQGTVLHVAILEKLIKQLPTYGSLKTLNKNGGTQPSSSFPGYFYVLKKMLPDASGTRLTGLNAGDQALYNTVNVDSTFINSLNGGKSFSWIPDVTKLHSDTLTVVVFLQNEATKEIYQADYFDIAKPAAGVVTGIEPIPSESIKVYPNPADQEFVIELPSAAKESMTIHLANQLGQLTEVGAFSEGEQSKKVSTHGLADGVYILQLGSNGNALRTKVIVVHK